MKSTTRWLVQKLLPPLRSPSVHSSIHVTQTCFGRDSWWIVNIAARSFLGSSFIHLNDDQLELTALARHSFSWAPRLLAWGKDQSLINFFNLPAMTHDKRAKNLEAFFRGQRHGSRSSLFALLLRCHGKTILWQWSVTVLQSFVSYGPQFAMYKILIQLESSPVRNGNERGIWLWALVLGCIRLFQTFVDARCVFFHDS